MNWLVAVLGPLQGILKIAKWRNVLPTIFLLFALTSCGIVWHNRVVIGSQIVRALDDKSIRKVLRPATFPELSTVMRKRVDSFTAQDNFVDMTVVVAVNQGDNIRTILYRSISDEAVAARVAKQDALTNRETVLPLRTSNEVWNKQIYAVLDGEFQCWTDADSLATSLWATYPTLEGVVKTVCRISIPPSWSGSMAGYIAFFSTKELTQEERDKLRIKARYLSLDIYTVDVQQEPTPVNR